MDNQKKTRRQSLAPLAKHDYVEIFHKYRLRESIYNPLMNLLDMITYIVAIAIIILIRPFPIQAIVTLILGAFWYGVHVIRDGSINYYASTTYVSPQPFYIEDFITNRKNEDFKIVDIDEVNNFYLIESVPFDGEPPFIEELSFQELHSNYRLKQELTDF